MECESMRFIVNKEIIPLYLDTAKTFMNLSAGALGLSITFREKVVGTQPGSHVSYMLLVCWLCYLLSIGASAAYQHFAVSFLDYVSCFPQRVRVFETLIQSPGKVYSIMLFFFFLASLLLVIAAWRQLPRND